MTRNGVCFTVSCMRGGASEVSEWAGEAGRRSSQRAGARENGAGPFDLEERGGMKQEAKGLVAPLSVFVHHM